MSKLKHQNVVVALDINGTLLKRVYCYDKAGISSFESAGKATVIKNHMVYYRPHLRKLSDFLESNNIRYVFWSTMYRHNLVLYVKALEEFGFSNYLACYDESYCKVGNEKGRIKAKRWLKDLRVLADAYSISLRNCVLIDDDLLKNAEGCNLIPVKEYDPRVADEELLQLIDRIKSFIDTR